MRTRQQASTLVFTFALSLAAASNLAAQDSWGVSTSYVPKWETPEIILSFVTDSTEAQIAGSEFRLGFVRGRELGGDWGVSFVRKTLTDDSAVYLSDDCVLVSGSLCLPEGSYYSLRETKMTGVEIHKFSPFGTIKNRVQIGLLYGGGIAAIEGQAQGVEFDADSTRASTLSASELFIVKTMPLVRFELAVAGIVAPGLKVRVSGGINSPGRHNASITFIYLFGGR